MTQSTTTPSRSGRSSNRINPERPKLLRLVAEVHCKYAPLFAAFPCQLDDARRPPAMLRGDCNSLFSQQSIAHACVIPAVIAYVSLIFSGAAFSRYSVPQFFSGSCPKSGSSNFAPFFKASSCGSRPYLIKLPCVPCSVKRGPGAHARFVARKYAVSFG